MQWLLALAAFAVWASPGLALAGEAAPAPDDPALERRVLAVSAELRCLVCQNQTIADSNAELAVDLRKRVREMMRNGSTEDDVIEYMVARYGEFVLYRPRLRVETALLWFGPALLMMLSLGVAIGIVLRRRQSARPAILSTEERAAARNLLEPTAGGSQR